MRPFSHSPHTHDVVRSPACEKGPHQRQGDLDSVELGLPDHAGGGLAEGGRGGGASSSGEDIVVDRIVVGQHAVSPGEVGEGVCCGVQPTRDRRRAAAKTRQGGGGQLETPGTKWVYFELLKRQRAFYPLCPHLSSSSSSRDGRCPQR